MKDLTKQELLVLGLIAKGFANKEIAAELNISLVKTKTYITSIYKKLEVSNRVLATIKALTYNIIQL